MILVDDMVLHVVEGGFEGLTADRAGDQRFDDGVAAAAFEDVGVVEDFALQRFRNFRALGFPCDLHDFFDAFGYKVIE